MQELLRLHLLQRLALGVRSHPTASRSKVTLTKSTPSNYRLAYQAGSRSAHSNPTIAMATAKWAQRPVGWRWAEVEGVGGVGGGQRGG